jgi:Alkaline phosphatase
MVVVVLLGTMLILNTNVDFGFNTEDFSVVGALPGAKAKYIFFFIGDGMGLVQRNAAEIYLASTRENAPPESVKLTMNSFPAQGMSTTYAADRLITGSAAAATALATGHKTNIGVISMDPSKTVNFKTMAEMAREKDMKVGIISSVSIDHATPAGFYAHQPSRNNYYEIEIDLANSNFDYFGGGGFKKPNGPKGDQPSAFEIARANGYTVVNSRAEFDRLSPGVGKVLVIDPIIDSSKALYYEIDRNDEMISLAEYTRKGIELLDNPNGFFMMVEGGKIDWACHANDAASAIIDTLAFDEAINEAVEFYKEHPGETLIVVTGDHECGGMTIGFAGTHYESFFEKIQHQQMSYIEFNKILQEYKETHTPDEAKFEDLIPLIRDSFGLIVLSDKERAQFEAEAEKSESAKQKLSMVLADYEIQMIKDAFQMSMMEKDIRSKDEQNYLIYGGYEPITVALTHLLNQKAGIGWTSYSHTGVPVPVSAIGVGSSNFNGYYDNTDIAKKIMFIGGLS